MSLAPPTTRLPPIKQIASQDPQDLADAVVYLRSIYNPPVRGARRRDRRRGPDDLADSSSREQLGLQADKFERSYAIRWLTALVAFLTGSDSLSEQELRLEGESVDVRDGRESLVRSASALLAICSGTSGAGVVTREFVFFPPPRSSSPIKIHMRDVSLDNQDYGSVGAQTWGGACVMAEMIVEDPRRFGLHPGARRRRRDPLRVLELGAGTGLVSLCVVKVLQRMLGTNGTDRDGDDERRVPSATVIATDYYPSVLANLRSNALANSGAPNPDRPAARSEVVSLAVHRLDWSTFLETPERGAPPFDAPFDVVLGADVVYEAEHASWIKSCLTTALLRRPRSRRRRKGNVDEDEDEPEPVFHLIIPLRHTHASESRTVETVFGFASDAPASRTDDAQELDLCILSKEVIVCDAGPNLETDEVEYAYYVIAWR